jgi:hypothetical protein
MEDGSVMAVLDVGISRTRTVARVVEYPIKCKCVKSGAGRR